MFPLFLPSLSFSAVLNSFPIHFTDDKYTIISYAIREELKAHWSQWRDALRKWNWTHAIHISEGDRNWMSSPSMTQPEPDSCISIWNVVLFAGRLESWDQSHSLIFLFIWLQPSAIRKEAATLHVVMNALLEDSWFESSCTQPLTPGSQSFRITHER